MIKAAAFASVDTSTNERIKLLTVGDVHATAQSTSPVVVKCWSRFGPSTYSSVLYSCGMTERGLPELLMLSSGANDEQAFARILGVVQSETQVLNGFWSQSDGSPDTGSVRLEDPQSGEQYRLDLCTHWFIAKDRLQSCEDGATELSSEDFLAFGGFSPELAVERILQSETKNAPRFVLVSSLR